MGRVLEHGVGRKSAYSRAVSKSSLYLYSLCMYYIIMYVRMYMYICVRDPLLLFRSRRGIRSLATTCNIIPAAH